MTPSVQVCFIEECYLKTESLKTSQMNFSEELNVVRHQQNRLPGNFWQLMGTFRSVEAFLLFWLRRISQRSVRNSKQITGETCTAGWNISRNMSENFAELQLISLQIVRHVSATAVRLHKMGSLLWMIVGKERTNFTDKAWFHPSGRVNSQWSHSANLRLNFSYILLRSETMPDCWTCFLHTHTP